MFKYLAKLLFKINGWVVEGSIPEDLKKAVIIAAPHTSFWDFYYARIAFFIMGIPMKVTIKKEVVNHPVYGWLIRSLGAIAIDRTPKEGNLKKKRSMVDAMVSLIEERDELIMMVTPEGTRKRVKKWKSGFYRVAEQANIPIVLGYLDYAKKHAGVGPVFYPTGDIDKDVEEIKKFYISKTGKYPDQGVF
jgi:1-acyl-sn-glycerol-3-phosphate acyltransferase